MKQKQIFDIVALAMVAVLGVSMVSGFGFKGLGNYEMAEEEIKVQREAVKDAIENEDYEAWQTLMNEKISKMQDKITQENFEKIVEKHNEMSEIRELKEELREARENGDIEKVEELKTQIKELMPEGKGFRSNKIRMKNFHVKIPSL